jgi:hypothetical protein
MALLLDAGAAFAFDLEADAPAAATPETSVLTIAPQSCMLPAAMLMETMDAQAATLTDTGTRS